MINNYHILTIKYVGPTDYKPSKVKIISERFQESKVIPYDHQFSNTLEIAEDWLQKNGFVLIGHGEGKGHSYVISDTFKPLK